MRHTKEKGFTLIELLVVIAIIALLVSILMPSLAKARELAKRAKCAMSLNSIGKAFMMYTTETSDDQFPWIPNVTASTWETPKVGVERDPLGVSPLPAKARSLSALPWMIVRYNQPAALFNCPSDITATECTNTKNTTNNTYQWDFENALQCSYGYQMPMTGGTAGINGVSASAPGGMPIMADKLAAYDTTYTAAIGVTNDPAVMPKYMPTAHNGEYLNFLVVSGSVSNGRKPDCGPGGDNIYSTSTTATPLSPLTVSPTVALHKFTGDSAIYINTTP